MVSALLQCVNPKLKYKFIGEKQLKAENVAKYAGTKPLVWKRNIPLKNGINVNTRKCRK